jgi:hypothetical protein
MRTTTWKEIAELGGISAILVGLVFVYLEIQQNGVIARADLASDTSIIIDGIYQQLSDPGFSEIYTKSLRAPAELTVVERLQLNAFFERVTQLFSREMVLFRLGVFGEMESIPNNFAPIFFSRGYGESWWLVRKKTFSIAMVEVVDSALLASAGRRSFPEFDSQIMRQIETLSPETQ